MNAAVHTAKTYLEIKLMQKGASGQLSPLKSSEFTVFGNVCPPAFSAVTQIFCQPLNVLNPRSNKSSPPYGMGLFPSFRYQVAGEIEMKSQSRKKMESEKATGQIRRWMLGTRTVSSFTSHEFLETTIKFLKFWYPGATTV